MTMTGFSIRTSTAERHTKLARNTDVIVTLIPLPGDGESVMNDDKRIPIPWKILTFQANSNTYRSIAIPSKIGVCTVKEKANGVLTPQACGTLKKGGETVLKSIGGEEGELQWIDPSDTAEQTASTETTTLASANDNFVIKNEHEVGIALALCLIDDNDDCLPIFYLGELPQGQIITINGQLCVQVHAMTGQIVGKPLTSTNTAPLMGPMAVVNISQVGTKLALCLIDEKNDCLPIVDLGKLRKDQMIKINGQLRVQVHAMNCLNLLVLSGKAASLDEYSSPMAVVDISNLPLVRALRAATESHSIATLTGLKDVNEGIRSRNIIVNARNTSFFI
ncbi:hypothetical protein BDR04DRAFT_1154320 [Suillus decipiens]|nr:hypothetical protein BDR04DRAFT_1154320 [Suillus decipiens]